MRLIINMLVLFLFISCTQHSKIEGDIKIMDQSVLDNLKIVEKSKIYFGHKSVGYDIMNGLEDLITESGNENINIIETDGKQELPEFYFAHSQVGKNTKPNTKCDAFSEILSDEFAKNLDIALLKFCFVDIRAGDSPNAVFDYYKTTIDSIKIKYPNLKIIHVTIPLTGFETGWKVPIKKILGRYVGGVDENVKRFQFNTILKDYYVEDPIFDLSTVESTYPDGSRESFERDGNTYYALVPQYTDDGGHLNDLGRQLAAKELIRVIAETIKNRENLKN